MIAEGEAELIRQVAAAGEVFELGIDGGGKAELAGEEEEIVYEIRAEGKKGQPRGGGGERQRDEGGDDPWGGRD